MHFYKVGYWTSDGEAAIGLYHEQAFAPEAFEALVHEAVAEIVTREKRPLAHFPFAWIYDDVASLLVARHGFGRIEYTAEFEIYGSGSILENDPAWPDLDKLTRYLQARGLAPPPDDRG